MDQLTYVVKRNLTSTPPTEHKKACCKDPNIQLNYERGEKTCWNCGKVLDDRVIESGVDVRAYNYEEHKKRGHRKPMGPKKKTEIDKSNAGVPPGQKPLMYRLRKLQSQVSNNSKLRSLMAGSSEIWRLTAQLDVTYLFSDACDWYDKVFDARLVRGRSVESTSAACVHLACRYNHIVRTIDETVEQTTRTKKQVTRAYRVIVKELNLNVPPFTAVDYVPIGVSELNLSPGSEKKIIDNK